MAYRIDGTAKTPCCYVCVKPLWNRKRAYKHAREFSHKISHAIVKRGEFPRKGANAGEKNGTHKLNWNLVKYIRWLYGRGHSTYALASFAGVSQNAIWLCVTGKTWKCAETGLNGLKSKARA